MKAFKEQLSKTKWVAGISKMNYSDIKNKEKIEKAIGEAIKDLSKNLREFVTVRMAETAEDVQDGKIAVRVEIRVFEDSDKKILFMGCPKGEEIII
jgi:flavin-binding protein dodecin